MGPLERRMDIWRKLCCRRHDTIAHFAAEYNVSTKTISHDIEYLSLIYPIETVRGRYHGGVKILDGYTPGSNVLTPVQAELLQRLIKMLNGNDKIIMESIIMQYAAV